MPVDLLKCPLKKEFYKETGRVLIELRVFGKGCRVTQAARFIYFNFGGASVTAGNFTLLVLMRLQSKCKFE